MSCSFSPVSNHFWRRCKGCRMGGGQSLVTAQGEAFVAYSPRTTRSRAHQGYRHRIARCQAEPLGFIQQPRSTSRKAMDSGWTFQQGWVRGLPLTINDLPANPKNQLRLTRICSALQVNPHTAEIEVAWRPASEDRNRKVPDEGRCG